MTYLIVHQTRRSQSILDIDGFLLAGTFRVKGIPWLVSFFFLQSMSLLDFFRTPGYRMIEALGKEGGSKESESGPLGHV